MRRNRFALMPAIALVTALMLVAGACGDDKEDASSKKTTTTEKKTTTTAKSGDDSASTTLDPADYDAAMTSIEEQVDAAGGDVCKIAEVFSSMSNLPDPSNAEEGKRAVALVSTLLNAIADSAPPENAQSAATISKAAKNLEAEAKDAGYSDEFLQSPKALDNEEFNTAMQEFNTAATAQCSSAGPASTTP